jgi:hypothetical protein
MKTAILNTALLFLLPLCSIAGPSDTTINGVAVTFDYNLSIFPGGWQLAPINAKGEQLSALEIARCKKVMAMALKKYPSAVLAANLKHVFWLKSMKFYDVGFGGTNATDALYLTNAGEAMGYTDHYLEQTFHHEFSSILFRNFPNYLDTIAWQKSNADGFIYNDPEDGVGAIRKNQSSQELDTASSRRGLLTQYAMSGMENDINTIAQNLFSPAPEFWSFVDRFPRIRKKTKLLIAFYNRFNPLFTEQYFRSLKN